MNGTKIKTMDIETHSLIIGNVEYFVQGSNTQTLRDIAKVINLNYDSLEPSKLPSGQNIIKVWGIGELKDHLENK